MVAVLLIALALIGEITQADIDAYAVRAKLERPKALAAAKKQLIAIRRDRSLTVDDKRARVQSMQQKIERLRNLRSPYYAPLGLDLRSLPEGKWLGWIEGEYFVCNAVVDEQNALIDRVSIDYRGKPGSHTTYWLSGVSTKAFADGKEVELRGVFAVGESKSFETAIGSIRTVPMIEYVDVAKHSQKFVD